VVTPFLVLSDWVKEFLMLKELLPIVSANHNKLNLHLIILQVYCQTRIKGCCHQVGLTSNKYICPQPYFIGITVRYLYSMLK